MSFYRINPINSDKNLQAYVIGLSIGDGNLSNPNGRATKLRITCDDKYPFLKERIFKSLQNLFPNNKIGTVDKKENCSDIYVYSNQLEKFLGWRAKGGSKFIQNVHTPKWIKGNQEYIINYLRGLIETDGAIYLDRGYKMVIFSSILEQLSNEVFEMIQSLGFKPKIYKVKQKFGTPFKYHVRLSKDVQKFIDLVRPEKR